MSNLFEKPGQKLKKWAKYLFILNCIGFAVMAIVLANQEYYSSFYGRYYHEWNFGIFLGILVGGVLFSYFECLVLYGFGELIENSAKSEGTKQVDEAEAKVKAAEAEAQAKKEAEEKAITAAIALGRDVEENEEIKEEDNDS